MVVNPVIVWIGKRFSVMFRFKKNNTNELIISVQFSVTDNASLKKILEVSEADVNWETKKQYISSKSGDF